MPYLMMPQRPSGSARRGAPTGWLWRLQPTASRRGASAIHHLRTCAPAHLRSGEIARPLTLHPVIRCPAIPLSCFPALGTSALPDGNSRNQVFNFIHLGPERFSGVGVISLGRANCVRTCNARQADQAPVRGHHEQYASRRYSDGLVRPGHNGAHDRFLARAALGAENETTLNVRQV
jgi:hypothetical protein